MIFPKLINIFKLYKIICICRPCKNLKKFHDGCRRYSLYILLRILSQNEQLIANMEHPKTKIAKIVLQTVQYWSFSDILCHKRHYLRYYFVILQ